jgi:hypothetical protein
MSVVFGIDSIVLDKHVMNLVFLVLLFRLYKLLGGGGMSGLY